ncbi:M20/M25/M40 family metallo-hydrolase [Salinimicrobium tongyeongense]|uniref:M20/M25/M40 family metallo-hydrolase n=1 Tax=Salinimicrobium tongyeongense TaxID=2809707 RepID=A0ABY6NNW3_9FLAO|nr:M28 family peptidase [Salinimicrobium tongyeongense]UZH54286.1 M20/M25/M40 family metallo-hydrolase [Salinimicrobium tongyeongense]
MRKFTLTGLAAASLLVFAACGQSKEAAQETAAVSFQKESVKNAILEEDISSALKYLSSDELQGRATGTEGIEKAARYIEKVFKEQGVEPFFETYRDSFEVKGKTGYNLVGLVEGTDPQLKNEYLVVGAHYDHVGHGKPFEDDTIANGANDNASGTTAVLELAKFFAENPPKRSMLFSLFSAEELGLVGAAELAKELKTEGVDLYTMFNIEMVGVPMKDKDYLAYLTGYENSNLAQKFNEYSGAKLLGFLPEAKQYSLFKRSDNYPFFQEFNVPAQTISTFDFTNFDYYHHVEDEFEKMDVSHMEHLIEAIIPGIAGMANSAEKEIKLNEQ